MGQVALPNSANNVSDLVLTAQAFPTVTRTKVTGGLINFLMSGVLVHTNTIEEFASFDMQSVIDSQKAKISNEVKEHEGLKVSMANRFVLCLFGDLKNYVYHYKFATLEYDVKHINQVKANKVSALLQADIVVDLCAKLQE